MMTRIAPLAFAALLSVGLAACNQTTVASSPSGESRTGYNSASMPPASVSATPARQAQAMGRSYAGCRSQFPADSSDYNACLQNLPASALVASNR